MSISSVKSLKSLVIIAMTQTTKIYKPIPEELKDPVKISSVVLGCS